ncbi:hypothetical protein Val02_60550 [Virgisporangium aliadipatigenens]|uniref:Uncharacterized protein n=1 Tax=Virgisporangium aliadipatigenens TaxID=741659 RepID=A0A8J3YP75_9ACTN|nr:hypothetical protein [Virgisporangium aliadipatigenens]GIJ49169.1 hypothetical protein Val02_60550 [Virgisporangium aliadipatigenens]
MAATTLDSVRPFPEASTILADLGDTLSAAAGGGPFALARAVRGVSAERLRAVPAAGLWDAARLFALLDGVHARGLSCLPLLDAGGAFIPLYGLLADPAGALVVEGERRRPVAEVAAELDGGRPGTGGVLLVVPAPVQQTARALVHAADLRMQWWSRP